MLISMISNLYKDYHQRKMILKKIKMIPIQIIPLKSPTLKLPEDKLVYSDFILILDQKKIGMNLLRNLLTLQKMIKNPDRLVPQVKQQ